MIKIILLIILPIALYCQCSYNYVIHRPSISKIVSEDTIENYGYKLADMTTIKGQPFRITSFFIAPNTNYLMLSVVPKTTPQKTMINNIVSQGYGLFISSENVVLVKNQRYDCLDAAIEIWNARKLPVDFYAVWGSSK